jgi:valyl-tRNA synthetase
MEKSYTPQLHDKKWQEIWKNKKVGEAESVSQHPQPSGETFTMMMPPPNVTGVLHQGHALFLALQDTLARWHRMRGDKTLYLPGTDHASIAVQMQVVKHLASQSKNHRDLGREGFLKECWKWIENYQPRIFSQIESMGTSCDWSRVKFTMDPKLNEGVSFAFVELFNKGLIYRDKRLVNWSPKGETVLSDLEVLFEERDTFLWHIRYHLKDDPSKFLVVSTTRPETLLGDTAVAVHPEDERYKAFIGKMLRLPVVDRDIPVLADDFVDPAFGSGVVKITPAHDFNDFEVGKRHKLPLLNVFTKEAKIVGGLASHGAKLAGLDRFAARDQIEKWLEEWNLLAGKDKYRTRIGKSERWGDVVEPYLSDQWFCKMDGMAKAVHGATTSGELEFVPHEFHNQFLRWMENIKDWCISRQLCGVSRFPLTIARSVRRLTSPSPSRPSAASVVTHSLSKTKMFWTPGFLRASGLFPLSAGPTKNPKTSKIFIQDPYSKPASTFFSSGSPACS